MNFKRFLSTALTVATVVSAMSVTTVFAGDPTFRVGNPIDITTGEEITELTAGQIVEVPIDVENVDSGKLSMCQFHMYYDSTIFDPGAALASATTYYSKYRDYIARDTLQTSYLLGRHNMNEDLLGDGTILEAAGDFSGNLTNTTSSPSVAMLWTIEYADSMPVNDDEPEFYLLFTVKDDYDASTLGLNYGSQGLTGSGLFALDGIKVDETTTNNHPNISGVQADTKLNACYGAFTVSVDNDTYAAANKNWITGITAEIFTEEGGTSLGTYALEEYVKEDGSSTYSFPTRITTNSDSYTSAYVVITAATNTLEDGTGTASTTVLGAKTISLDGTVTSYEAAE